MEGGKSEYTPLLDTTFCKVIAFVPLEYVKLWRDVALLGSDPEEVPSCILKDYPIGGSLSSWEKPCIGAFPLFFEEAIFHTLVGLILFSCQNMFKGA